MDVDEDIDAFARARKINNIGKVDMKAPSTLPFSTL